MATQGKLFEPPVHDGATSRVLAPEPGTRFRLVLERSPEWSYEALASCSRPADAAAVASRLVAGEYRERLGVLYLDGRNRAIGHTIAAIGTIRAAPVDMRAIFVPALLANAAAIIVFHNHPSGDPKPSREDVQVTRTMAETGKIVGVGLVDHLILGEPPRFTSMRERGVL